MKRLKTILLATSAMYIVGFFATLPLGMLATSTQVAPIMQVAHGIQYKLYWSWVKHIDEPNIIRSIWNKNGYYWCEKFERCQVIDPETNS